jgi:DNA-binding Xre family transcriptional regulator
MANRTTLDPAEERAMHALDLMMRLRDINDGQLAERVGMDRNSIFKRRVGRARIRPGNMDDFAAALGVPAELFRKEAPDILRWFADNAAPGGNVTLLPYRDVRRNVARAVNRRLAQTEFAVAA